MFLEGFCWRVSQANSRNMSKAVMRSRGAGAGGGGGGGDNGRCSKQGDVKPKLQAGGAGASWKP